MIVAIMMIFPIGMIPGIGGGLGLLPAAIGVQMIGRDGVWVPRFVRRRSVWAKRVNILSRRMHPVSAFLARHLRERLEWIATGRASMSVIAHLLIVCAGRR